MRHLAAERFWRLYDALPQEVRQQADKNFALLKSDPDHPSLHLKKLGRLWSARVFARYRVLGVDTVDGILWVWIGTHREYERLIHSQLREPEPAAYAS